ncbi:MAG: hypothetical protein COV76_02090 [Candidatus Omnitrophica bacterium CG11_big_fil_rev_8_21_14_0_20_64_10]|nr:MAG: hypothetical protein COV76_02090 [Candidatus Omnitrophica bacterium CG11_big_fil_rev_8_21_14_0_20_64_10]
MTAVKAENYRETEAVLAGWPVKIVSYKAGAVYRVSVHNKEPGAWIVKTAGPTLEEAEAQARKLAEERLSKTRRLS